MLAVYFWRRIATAGHCCRIATAGDYSLLQSDHELSSIINQRAPERPSLGRGQLKLELSILEERCTLYFMFISSGAQEIKNTIACNYNLQSQHALVTLSCVLPLPSDWHPLVAVLRLGGSAGEAAASEANRESAAILGLRSPPVLSHRPATTRTLHAGCSAIICRVAVVLMSHQTCSTAAAISAQIGDLVIPQLRHNS